MQSPPAKYHQRDTDLRANLKEDMIQNITVVLFLDENTDDLQTLP